MTAQEIFDKVFEHLVSQGRRSVRDMSHFCQYRLVLDSGEVLKCAVGCLIPDELYDPDMEGLTVTQLFRDYPQIMQKAGIDNFLELLKRLQSVHDGCFTTVEDIMVAMRGVSIVAGLEYRVPNVQPKESTK